MAILLDTRVGSRLTTTWELELEDVTRARFAQLVMERALEHVTSDSWDTERMTLEGLFDYALTSQRDHVERDAVLDLGTVIGDDCLVYLLLERGHAYVDVAARSVDAFASAKAWLRKRYPVFAPEESESQQVSMTFWWLSGDGERASRTIDVPTWTEIAANYPNRVAHALEQVMSASYRPERGQLFLWQGQPGTGKTYALRALAWQWRKWCRFHYITDPEQFFGGDTDYMMSVLLAGAYDDEDTWRLLILEDTGELLAADAKERTGQGLSRLLNVVDGLIGQGLRVMVLVTTNETLGRLHPAVSRPGRCAELVGFEAFSEAEARDWLERHGSDAVARGGTLASLYAWAAGAEAREKRPVGFTC